MTKPPLSKTRILIAEDNPSVREFITRALKTPDTEIVGAVDGQQALGIMARESFDILVTDLVMPHVDGIALALKAQQQYPHLKILMITGYAHEAARAHNLTDLAHHLLSKPFSLEEIQQAVAALTNTHQE